MPAEHMMALGEYRFSLSTAAYQEFAHSAEYRWAAQDRIGRPPGRQYVGPGAETVSLRGQIYPRFRGGLGQLARMRAEAGRGEPLDMVEGNGRAWGRFVITRVEETRRAFEADGSPRQIEFRLELARYAEDQEQSLQQVIYGGQT